MNARQKTKTDQFIAAGTAPSKVKSGAVLARQGGTRFQTLVDASGQLTAAGRYYQEKTGQDLPVGSIDNSQAPTRTQDTEQISLRDGTQRATRRWDPATQDYKFTALGRKFYGRLKRSYVVQVPVRVQGLRKNGSTYYIRSTIPSAVLAPIESNCHFLSRVQDRQLGI